MGKKKSSCILGILIVFLMVACSNNVEKNNDREVEFSKQLLTFEDSVLRSDTAIVGKYIETIIYEDYVEHKFEVKDLIYGENINEEIYLYSNIGIGHVEENGYSYQLDENKYEKDKEYILIMESVDSIFYDHTRYILNAELLLNETDKEYYMYSKYIDPPTGEAIKDYILEIYNSASHHSVKVDDTVYESDFDEMIAESDYIGKVTVLELVSEGRVHNGNTYRCNVEKLAKGRDLNRYDDGSILMVILKNSVNVGDTYIIGFDQVDDNSLIYTQAVKTSVYDYQDKLMNTING